MNVFEDLVADLKKENLLDDSGKEAVVFGGKLSFLEAPIVKTTSNSIFSEVSTYYDNTNFKLAEPLEKTSVKSFQTETLNNNENSYLKKDVSVSNPSVQSKKLRKVQVKPKKKGRYCKTCLMSVPYYRLSCRFCNERVGLNSFYFSLFFLVVLMAVMFLAIVGRNYI